MHPKGFRFLFLAEFSLIVGAARMTSLLCSPRCSRPPPVCFAPASFREGGSMTHTCLPVRLLACLLAVTAARTAPAADWAVTPREVVFKDAYDGRQLLVAEGRRDVTRTARYTSSDPAVVRVDDRGYLRPVGDGKTEVIVRGEPSEV